MNLHPVDLGIIALYIIVIVWIGFKVSKQATKSLDAYFLGENKFKWYMLGLSNASGMFDISGVMWTVSLLFIYGLKSAWIPWLWPVWNQVFVMVFLAIWLRRSGVMTGAQWINFRFGEGNGARQSHLIVTIFAIVSVLGFIAYFFVGIGKFASIFFPWDLSFSILNLNITSDQAYAIIIMSITTLYVIKGGMYSVVLSEVAQFVIMTLSCFVIGYIAFTQTTSDAILNAVPKGWDNIFFGWKLDLDWSGYIATVNTKIAEDGFELFGVLFMMMVLKGIFASIAGPVPSYDMQRILSTRTAADAAKMSGFTILVLFFPRYLMIAGFAALAIVYLSPQIAEMGTNIDFELILPLAIEEFVPVGFRGLLLAGLLAAFMGTFAAFINAAPAYIVNDVYKKYINPNAAQHSYVRLSIISSLVIVTIGVIMGFFANSINALTVWITSALYGGYAAANALKWIWWRFNGHGYFYGMLAGLIASTIVPIIWPNTLAIYLFPIILIMSMIGCLAGTLLFPPEKDAVLMHFYSKTKPWGWWKPIIKKLQEKDPLFKPNKNIKIDAFNVLIGIVWQMMLVILPIYIIIKDVNAIIVCALILIVCSYLLHKYWYRLLPKT